MKIKWLPIGSLILAAIAISSCNSLNQIQQTVLNGQVTNSGISQTEAQSGIQEALLNGIVTGITNLNKTDGFFGNEAYKILLPQDAQKVTSALKNIGMGSLVDKAVLQINRSAEDAVGYAKPIFVNAIKQMTVTDALGLVKGGNNSITQYFQQKTSAQLIQAFKPSIESSLTKTSATKYYGDIIKTYNSLPLVQNKLNPDLTDYVAQKTVSALFDQIGKEELNIRQNPVARTTDILKKVFGQK